MSLQPLFRQFHDDILLTRFGENAELREKRDRILKRLRDNLPYAFDPFNQGSYAMGTGIKPIKKDYDIDIGIVFNIDYRDYTPVQVKQWVYDAIQGHTTQVDWRRPCITVVYRHAGEELYHVDLAILAKDPYSGSLRLALGKQHSSKDQQEWQPDDRQGFIEAIERKFTGEDAAQFRRVIRYLKRWKDEHFSDQGRAAPTGLSLTVAAYHWFQPKQQGGYGSFDYDDLAATHSLVSALRQSFTWRFDPTLGRFPSISLQFPKAPHDNVFARMTPQQTLEFHGRLEKLSGWLEQARQTQNPAPLRLAFGEKFPLK